MALAINIMHGRGPSDEMYPQLQPKKTKIRYLTLQQKALCVLYITKKMEHFSFISGCVVRGQSVLKKTGSWCFGSNFSLE